MNEPRLQKPRVYVVDDERIIASTLASIITAEGGCEATPFYHPLEALAAVQTVAPDLLLSDVAMPGITGIELAIQVRALCPECKVLLLSGHAATEGLLRDARRKGHHFDLLSKPINPLALLLAIQRILHGRPIGHLD